jgi:ketosteroid isomerase-like protein
MGWFVDEPRYGFPGGMRTRLTAVVREEARRWKIVHMHVSVGVPDEEVQTLQARWGIT